MEIPPLKPWPDYSGYAIPVVPFLIYLGARGMARLFALIPSRTAGALAGAPVVSGLIVYPLYDSVRLVVGLDDDTRTRAAAWLAANPGQALVGPYASVTSTDGIRAVGALDTDDFRRLDAEYVLASSFMYDRYRVGSRLPDQDPSVYETQARYEALFARPFIEIAPAYRGFAFSNPTIRIVDLRPPAARAAHPMPGLR